MSWSIEHDRALWAALGSCPRTASGNLATNATINSVVKRLAAEFSRTDSAIKSRLKHLDDPSHAAHIRMFAPGVAVSRAAGSGSA